MSKLRSLAVLLLVVLCISAGTSRVGAHDLNTDTPLYAYNGVYSDNGYYYSGAVWTGSTLALAFSYVGPGTAYDIWFSSIDGSFSGQGYHQNHWASCDYGGFAVLQGSDGNLVVYDSNVSPCWATSTNGGERLSVQDDGNLVVYNSGTTPLWSVY